MIDLVANNEGPYRPTFLCTWDIRRHHLLGHLFQGQPEAPGPL